MSGAASVWPRRLAVVVLGLVAVTPAGTAAATGNAEHAWRLAYTPRVVHLTSNRDYVDWNHIVAAEYITPRHTRWGADRTHFGASVFDNSYGQFSQSVYAGLEWDWRALGAGQLFFSLSPGLVHGYKEPWENRVPLNKALGVGVVVVPAIGWQAERLGFAISLAGSAVALRGSWRWGGAEREGR